MKRVERSCVCTNLRIRLSGEQLNLFVCAYDDHGSIHSYPKPFSYAISARSEKARQLVMLAENDLMDLKSDAPVLKGIQQSQIS